MKPLPPNIINDIKSQLASGLSTRTVALNFGISQSKVAQIRKEIQGNIPTPRAGRPHLISERQQHFILGHLLRHHIETAVQAQHLLRETANIDVHVNTVRNVFYNHGLHGKKKIKKPLISKNHTKKRMKFVRNYGEKTIEDWKRVI